MQIFMIRDRKNKTKLEKKTKTCKIYLKMSRFCRTLNPTYKELKQLSEKYTANHIKTLNPTYKELKLI